MEEIKNETQEEAVETKEETVETPEETKETPETEEKEKKKTSKKKPKKDKKDEKIEELNDRLMRNLAEFENFRNRSEKEKASMFEVGSKSVIEKILPVVDNFERGLAAVPEDQKGSPFAEGMEKIYKQLMTVLEELEVKPIEALGKEFDPNLHNAVMHVEDEEKGENEIVEVFQKGFKMGDKVIRFAMVKVAN